MTKHAADMPWMISSRALYTLGLIFLYEANVIIAPTVEAKKATQKIIAAIGTTMRS